MLPLPIDGQITPVSLSIPLCGRQLGVIFALQNALQFDFVSTF